MLGCEVYRIRPLDKFDLSFEKITKKHYKKNDRAKEKFEDEIDNFLSCLRANPFDDYISDDENFPKGSYKPDFCFRKIRFIMPELQGASRIARLLYVVHSLSCSVFLVWVYTHEEYPKRPSDEELKSQLKLIEAILVDND